MKQLKVYTVHSIIYKLKICKGLAEIGRLNYVSASKFGIVMSDWYKIIAFINSASFKKKEKFYDDMNNSEFII